MLALEPKRTGLGGHTDTRKLPLYDEGPVFAVHQIGRPFVTGHSLGLIKEHIRRITESAQRDTT
jgi:hypothetical protein